jgi:chaperonin GroEL
MDLHRGSQSALNHIVSYLSANTKTITTTAEIAQVATISANGDTHVGELISQAMEKVGKVYFVTEHLVVGEEDFIVAGHSFFVRASLIASLCSRH